MLKIQLCITEIIDSLKYITTEIIYFTTVFTIFFNYKRLIKNCKKSYRPFEL